MPNILTFLLFPRHNQFQLKIWLALFLLTLSFTTLGNRTVAQTPVNVPTRDESLPSPPPLKPNVPKREVPLPSAPALKPVINAPPQLTNLLSQIDAAANQRNIDTVMQFYSPNFTHSDGLTRQNIAQALTELWQRYPQLKYQTQLQSWRPQGNAIIAQTVTNITGAQPQKNRALLLSATITSRQRYENGRIVSQEILSERSQIKAGTQPPTVEVKLPQQVKPGQQYNFDAIVQEPLGDDYLLGAVVEEPIKPLSYLQPSKIDLELLPAGGLFKLGQAPAQPNDLWISAVLIRGDGMTLVTQRLNVVGLNRPATQKPEARK